jgi:hypothetical protein
MPGMPRSIAELQLVTVGVAPGGAGLLRCSARLRSTAIAMAVRASGLRGRRAR